MTPAGGKFLTPRRKPLGTIERYPQNTREGIWLDVLPFYLPYVFTYAVFQLKIDHRWTRGCCICSTLDIQMLINLRLYMK